MSKRDTVILSAWVEPALRDHARQAAKESRMTFSAWVSLAVQQMLARQSSDRAIRDLVERGLRPSKRRIP